MLEIRDLHVLADGKEIIKGVSLKIKPEEIHALMGPNGSGKSSLALALIGHPRYKITSGEIILDGKNITNLSPDKKARIGLFLALQHPMVVLGVSVAALLRSSLRSLKKDMTAAEFVQTLKHNMRQLNIDESFASRSVNDGFSGGEKKKSEVLQLSLLKPKYAVLDETDSGLDVDSLKIVADAIKKASGPAVGILLITHYQRILKYIPPGHVHILVDGKIAVSGNHKLAEEIEDKGYEIISKIKSQKSKPQVKT